MTAITALLRDDLRGFTGYQSARSETASGALWLNANESPWPNASDIAATLHRYPEPQPEALRLALARLYGCPPQQLLIGRGSDEAIDLLVRALCRPGRDAVLVTPPVFGMYAVCARLQGARLLEVPLRDDADDFTADLDQIGRIALQQDAKLVFLCSPGNPAGASLPADTVLALSRQLSGHAIVVVDEAYVEFSDLPSLSGLVGVQPNLAVLRTLSKAHALAAARIGCLIADPVLIAALRHCQAPYPVAAPSAEQGLRALTPMVLAATRVGIAAVRRERERLRSALVRLPGVRRVYPSQGNFLLVRFCDVDATFRHLLTAGIVVRDMRAYPQLGDALRISIGTAQQNMQLLDVVGRVRAVA